MSQVLIGSNFITITKQDWVDWTVLADPLVNLLEEHLTQGLPIILPATSGQPLETTKNASELEQQIQQVINEEIRPALALDGGDIIFERFDKGIVYLQMLGSCSGCPSATMTLKEGIETRLKNQFPQVLSVLSIGGS
ncbi:MAG: NifU family protein [Bdellovibrionales bacterium]|nr:NifU family protein [Bdellovibrionales bacterium]